MTSVTAPATAASATTAARIGAVVSVLVTAFLSFDVAIHILDIAPVVEGARQLGFDPGMMPSIGVLELVCLALYVVPRTSAVGAVLLTGYLGGAFCAQLRIDAPVFSTLLFPIYTGALVWAGLWLRDRRVRDFVAGRR